MLSWIWLTAIAKCLGLGRLSSSSVLDLACLSDPHYIIPLGVPREDGHSLGHAQGKMVVTLDFANCKSKCLESSMIAKPTLSWTWLTAKSKFLGSDIFSRPTLHHSLEHAQEGWSFPRAYPRKDGHFLGRV
jgi:hypothetical protein